MLSYIKPLDVPLGLNINVDVPKLSDFGSESTEQTELTEIVLLRVLCCLLFNVHFFAALGMTEGEIPNSRYFRMVGYLAMWVHVGGADRG